jgi:hypothetical protein
LAATDPAPPPASSLAPGTPAAPAAKEAEREPAAVPQPPSSPAAPGAPPLKFNAFVDARYTNLALANFPTSTYNAVAESGFGIEDGAFIATYDKDRVSATLDIAFRRTKDGDYNPPAALASSPNASDTGFLTVGAGHSQAFVKYRAISDLALELGQFDTIFGVEVNKSRDRVFSKTGLIYDFMIPATHTGIMVEYAASGLTLRALDANPNNKGSNGISAAGDDKSEFGGAVSYSSDHVRGQLGYMTRSILKNGSASDRGDRALADFLLGATLGGFSVDFEYARLQDPSKNTLTANPADLEDPGQGFLAIAQYKLGDALLLGLRYENIADDPANNTANPALAAKSASSYGATIHYKLATEIELRTEFIANNFTNAQGASWASTRFDIGGILSF